MSTIEERVIKTIAEQLNRKPEEILPAANIHDDLETDSLDQVEIIMALEEEFDIEVSDEEGEKWGTVQNIIDYMTQRVHAS